MQVDILMATYNGEKYIENQLLSLLQQTYKNWKLFISDDGSTDGTMDIVDKYAKLDERIVVVTRDGKREGRKGAAGNFMHLTKFSQAPLAMFCDQDDIWFEKKIEIMVKCAKENFATNLPCMAYCDAYGYSDSHGVISFDGISQLHANDLKDFIFFNAGYQGCSIIFNNKLCQIIADYKGESYYMHDDIASLIAYVWGEVYRVNEKLMLYRQHEKNVTGNISKKSFLKFRKNQLISDKHKMEKDEFFHLFFDKIDKRKRKIFEGYLFFDKMNFLQKFLYIFRCHITYGGKYFKFYMKVLFQK